MGSAGVLYWHPLALRNLAWRQA